jgi:cohesin loading factor subunit SCC2
MSVILALDAPATFVRTKALKALGVIATSDSTILSAVRVDFKCCGHNSSPCQPNVRRIEGHLLDSSAAVRGAAVELIGKYIIDSPKVAKDYYQKIADRMAVWFIGMTTIRY